jgi:hypothetical protein
MYTDLFLYGTLKYMILEKRFSALGGEKFMHLSQSGAGLT